ncbi:MAG: glycosyltransferase [Ardenticatenaceae bacterium]|nr:glycosyltransferase [Ardenticatenaceae bacterium]MCB8949868.1 glycosyltransferase [Ardenticatenaceae bacterium]
MILTILGGFTSFALLILGITAVSNFLFFPRLKATQLAQQPKLSILIPARNEAVVIGQTIRALLAQTVTNFELILLDDQSDDGTGAIATQAANGDARFRLLSGTPLPPGWLGKNWACHQLSQAATGEYLLFADADVRWAPNALAALLALAQTEQADLLTVWPTQQTETWPERLVVPLMSFAILCYLPILPVHYTNLPAFAAANGQCLLFRREAYEKVGGHTAVHNNVIEDVALAKAIKAHKLRLRMADGNRLVSCRMYQNWPEVRAGFAKNILAGHGNSIPFLLLSTVFHWIIFLFPWLWFATTLDVWPLGLGLAGVVLRGGTAVFTHQRPLDALLMPISVLMMTRIAFQSIQWQRHGTAEWKGRRLEIGD